MTITTFFSRSMTTVTAFAILASALLLTHTGVSAVSPVLAANEEKAQMKAVVASTKKEIERRIQVLRDSTVEINELEGIDESLRKKMGTENERIAASLRDYSKKLDKARTLKEAQALSDALDSEYEKFKNAAVTGQLAANMDTQQDTKKQLTLQLADITAKMAEARALGKEIGNLLEQLQQVEQMIVSVNAIIASATTLMQSVMSGDQQKAMIILTTIFDQLGVSQALFQSAQSLLTTALRQLNTSFSTNG